MSSALVRVQARIASAATSSGTTLCDCRAVVDNSLRMIAEADAERCRSIFTTPSRDLALIAR